VLLRPSSAACPPFSGLVSISTDGLDEKRHSSFTAGLRIEEMQLRSNRKKATESMTTQDPEPYQTCEKSAAWTIDAESPFEFPEDTAEDLLESATFEPQWGKVYNICRALCINEGIH
jgi:hypothetical protein